MLRVSQNLRYPSSRYRKIRLYFFFNWSNGQS